MVEIDIVINYTGGSKASIESTIENCRNIVPVKNIYVSGCSRRKTSCKKVIFGEYDTHKIDHEDRWLAVIDQGTVVGAQFFYPFMAEILNDEIIYYPEEDVPYRYSQFLEKNIDLDFFMNNGGDYDFDKLIGSRNFIAHRNTWLNKSIGLTDNMVANNYFCLKSGMVIKVVRGMICKNIVGHSFDFDLRWRDVEKRDGSKISAIMSEQPWNAQRKGFQLFV